MEVVSSVTPGLKALSLSQCSFLGWSLAPFTLVYDILRTVRFDFGHVSHTRIQHTLLAPRLRCPIFSGQSTHTAYFILCQLRTVVLVPYYICHIIKAENVKINLTVDGLRHCPEWSSAPSWLLLSTSRKALGAMWSSWIVEEREGVFYWLLCITNISYEMVFQRSRLWQG